MPDAPGDILQALCSNRTFSSLCLLGHLWCGHRCDLWLVSHQLSSSLQLSTMALCLHWWQAAICTMMDFLIPPWTMWKADLGINFSVSVSLSHPCCSVSLCMQFCKNSVCSVHFWHFPFWCSSYSRGRHFKLHPEFPCQDMVSTKIFPCFPGHRVSSLSGTWPALPQN